MVIMRLLLWPDVTHFDGRCQALSFCSDESSRIGRSADEGLAPKQANAFCQFGALDRSGKGLG